MDDRPRVRINMAMTVDGKITSAAREYPRFTSRFDRERMDRLRAEADAVLVGAGTLRADDPPLGVRSPEMRAYRRSLGKADRLYRVAVSASLDFDLRSRFFSDAAVGDRIVATVERAPRSRVETLEALAQIWIVGDERVDLPELLRRLKRHGVEQLLVEGGGELNWAFVRDDLVDELYVTVAPRLLGGRQAPTLLEGAGLAMNEQRRLRLISLHREEDELYCLYEVER